MGRLTEYLAAPPGNKPKSFLDTNKLFIQTEDLVRDIRAVRNYVNKIKRPALRKAAKPVVKKSRLLVYSYDIKPGTPRRTKSGEFIKGWGGAVSATYSGGIIRARYFRFNLKRSLGVLPLKKTRNVFIGPKIVEKDATGDFGKTVARGNAWQAQIVFRSAKNFGQKVTQKALATTIGAVIRILDIEITKAVHSEGKKRGLR